MAKIENLELEEADLFQLTGTEATTHIREMDVHGGGEKTTTVNSFETQQSPLHPPPPQDRCKFVYLIMALHGVGTLMPWNMFINAVDYYEHYKLGSDEAYWYSTKFLTSLIWASQTPNLIFSWANIFFPCGGGSLKIRIVASLVIEIFICLLTMVLAGISMSPALFFGLTMFSICLMNTAGGFYQNSVYGIGAKIGYGGTVILGSNICGVFTSVTSIVILATGIEPLPSALFYFGTATLTMTLCLASYLLLPQFKFYRVLYQPPTSSLSGGGAAGDMVGFQHGDNIVNSNPQEEKKESKWEVYRAVLKKCWVQCYNGFTVFFVTLIIFPAIQGSIQALNEEFFIPSKYFGQVMCFLTFNVCSLLGNLVADHWVQWPRAKYLWIPVTLRLFLIPFFLLCNYNPRGYVRNIPVFIGDWIFWVGGIMLGLTNGYFSALAMMYCSKSVRNEEAGSAGMFGAAFFVTGVFVGACLSDYMPYTVARKL